MKKLLKTLLSISLTAVCFASDENRVVVYPDSGASSTRSILRDAIAYKDSLDRASSRYERASSSSSLVNLGFIITILKLKTFQDFLKDITGENAEDLSRERVIQQQGLLEFSKIGEEFSRKRVVQQQVPLDLSKIIVGYLIKSDPDSILKTAIRDYWKYLSDTVKQRVKSKFDPLGTLGDRAMEDSVLGNIAYELGEDSLLKLENLRAQHKHLSASTMVSRLLTKHVNDLTQQYTGRVLLESNHDWGIKLTNLHAYKLYEEYLGAIIFKCEFEPICIDYSTLSETPEDLYQQQKEAYYQSYPIVRQVRLNPNGLPLEIMKKFKRYFKKMYLESL